MYASELIETEITVNETTYTVELDLTAQLVDDSFSHEFGTEYLTSVELIEAEIETVYNEEGEVITSREIITQIENRIDLNDFDYVEFEF